MLLNSPVAGIFEHRKFSKNFIYTSNKFQDEAKQSPVTEPQYKFRESNSKNYIKCQDARR